MTYRAYSVSLALSFMLLGAFMVVISAVHVIVKDHNTAQSFFSFVAAIGAVLWLASLVSLGMAAMMPAELKCPKCHEACKLVVGGMTGKPSLQV